MRLAHVSNEYPCVGCRNRARGSLVFFPDPSGLGRLAGAAATTPETARRRRAERRRGRRNARRGVVTEHLALLARDVGDAARGRPRVAVRARHGHAHRRGVERPEAREPDVVLGANDARERRERHRARTMTRERARRGMTRGTGRRDRARAGVSRAREAAARRSEGASAFGTNEGVTKLTTAGSKKNILVRRSLVLSKTSRAPPPRVSVAAVRASRPPSPGYARRRTPISAPARRRATPPSSPSPPTFPRAPTLGLPPDPDPGPRPGTRRGEKARRRSPSASRETLGGRRPPPPPPPLRLRPRAYSNRLRSLTLARLDRWYVQTVAHVREGEVRPEHLQETQDGVPGHTPEDEVAQPRSPDVRTSRSTGAPPSKETPHGGDTREWKAQGTPMMANGASLARLLLLLLLPPPLLPPPLVLFSGPPRAPARTRARATPRRSRPCPTEGPRFCPTYSRTTAFCSRRRGRSRGPPLVPAVRASG